jgi:DNA-dependent metalloprotease WSS1
MSHHEFEPLVNQFQHESHRKRAAEALASLQKIASIVKPIMRQRNWHVGTLCEFYPADISLLGLNINRGEKICLRLRYPGDENQFLPLEEVVDTMLHELCHNIHGPHDQHFHALWNQLRDEHEALVRKGYTGEGFLGHGDRLGGRRIPMHEARRIARINAEKRRALAAGSGRKLGGTGIGPGVDPRQVIVNAIERRLAIEKGCASETEKGRQIAQEVEKKKEGITMTKAEDDDENEARIMQAYMDLIQEEEKEKYGASYVPPSESNPAGMQTNSTPPISPNSLKAQQASIERSIKGTASQPASRTVAIKPETSRPSKIPPPRTAIEQVPDTWTCEVCTLVNPFSFLSCDACGIERPFTPSPPLRENPWTSSNGAPRNSRRETPNALKPRLNVVDSLAKLDEQSAYKKNQPIGWTCICSNFMENEWWTCSACGRMKQSS